ncbi:hypothetical protein EXIGLDRAFT_760930 [Exidia glandulosa HHB12029]|uniref:Uncharacterized protein n=1 Tax=Exidia glandulosa HHB12029 TaxID=1314781 RepID=A0A165NSN4_EXIGL|nr:hypothetical protein EXIGLDRAFT_760930 [Exidia glandulosa HHB12029]
MIPSSRSLQRTLTSSGSSTLWDDASVADDEQLFSEMPKHWRKDFSDCAHRWAQPYLEGLFATLCLIAVGYASLDRRWEFMTRGERLDREHTGHIATRLTTITVTAGLLLATTATLITTDAPRADILDYTITGPYICLWASFGLLIGGAIVGSADIFVMSTSTREWTLRILMATRARVFCVLILLAYPFISIGIATLVLAFGMVTCGGLDVAEWSREDRMRLYTRPTTLHGIPIRLLRDSSVEI